MVPCRACRNVCSVGFRSLKRGPRYAFTTQPIFPDFFDFHSGPAMPKMPKADADFVGHIFESNQYGSFKVVGRTGKRKGTNAIYEVEFLTTGYRTEPRLALQKDDYRPQLASDQTLEIFQVCEYYRPLKFRPKIFANIFGLPMTVKTFFSTGTTRAPLGLHLRPYVEFAFVSDQWLEQRWFYLDVCYRKGSNQYEIDCSYYDKKFHDHRSGETRIVYITGGE